MTKQRIVLGDDHLLILEALKSALEPEFEVVGMASDGQQLLNETERAQPDAVLIDINMPVLNGFAVAREIKSRQPAVKILFLTHSSERACVNAAFESGASAYVLKQSSGMQVVSALRHALAGSTYISPQLAPADPRVGDGVRQRSLSTAQQQLLGLLATGKGRAEIAGLLNLSVRTVEFLESELMQHFGCSDREALMEYAAQVHRC